MWRRSVFNGLLVLLLLLLLLLLSVAQSIEGILRMAFAVPE
jgi:hypothetical protein